MSTGCKTNNIDVDESLKRSKMPAWIPRRSNAVFVAERKPAHAVYTLPEVWRHARRNGIVYVG